MTTTTPKFETTTRHSALGFVVIASLCVSLAAGFLATASKSNAPSADLRAAASVTSTQHAS